MKRTHLLQKGSGIPAKSREMCEEDMSILNALMIKVANAAFRVIEALDNII
jgi:hypothetical protein